MPFNHPKTRHYCFSLSLHQHSTMNQLTNHILTSQDNDKLLMKNKFPFRQHQHSCALDLSTYFSWLY